MANPVLEIHHISVSAGDATIIAARDSENDNDPKTITLIDAGQNSSDLKIIETYCNKHFSGLVLDYFILSHAHDDHYGFMPDVMVKKKYKLKNKQTEIAKCDLYDEKKTNVVFGQSINAGLSVGKSQTKTEIKFNDKNDPVTLNLAKGITLTCCCANGVPLLKGYKSKRLDDFHKKDGKNDESNFSNFMKAENISDENDLSLAWLLEYKPKSGKTFRYFTAGDLSGIKAGGYTNIEKELIEMFNDVASPLKEKQSNNTFKDLHVDVLKATHHGSKYSSLGESGKKETETSSSAFLKRLKPTQIIVPCNNHHNLPYPEFFGRAINNGINEIYLVNFFFRRADGDYDFPLKISYPEYWLPNNSDKKKGVSNILLAKGIQKNVEDKYKREAKQVLHFEAVEEKDYKTTTFSDLEDKNTGYFKCFTNTQSKFTGNKSAGLLPSYRIEVETSGKYKTKKFDDVTFTPGKSRISRLKNELLNDIPNLLPTELLAFNTPEEVNHKECKFNAILKLGGFGDDINAGIDQNFRNTLMGIYDTDPNKIFQLRYVRRNHIEAEILRKFQQFLKNYKFADLIGKIRTTVRTSDLNKRLIEVNKVVTDFTEYQPQIGNKRKKGKVTTKQRKRKK